MASDNGGKQITKLDIPEHWTNYKPGEIVQDLVVYGDDALDFGDDANREMYAAYDTLHDVVRTQYVHAVRALIKRGAVLTNVVRGVSAVHIAAAQDECQILDMLIAAGVDVNSVSRDVCRTPLHFAASNGLTRNVSVLLEAGADPTMVDKYGRTPLHIAAYSNSLDIVLLLINAVPAEAKSSYVNLSSNSVDYLLPLQSAVAHGSMKIIEVLVNHGAALSCIDSKQSTLLHYASSSKHPKVLRYLLQLSACQVLIDNRNLYGLTALHDAAHRCCPECILVLLQHGANAHIMDSHGRPPMYYCLIGVDKNHISPVIQQCIDLLTGGGGAVTKAARQSRE